MHTVIPEGIYAALPTPFRDHDVDEDALRRIVERLNASPLRGYLVLGSNGEAPHLSLEERLRVVATAVGAAGAGRLVLVGASAFSTWETVHLVGRAADLGASCALVMPPYYYQRHMSPEAVQAHYRAVIRDGGLPVLVYHAPSFSSRPLEEETLLALAEEGAAGVKDSSGRLELLAHVTAVAPEGFRFFTGSGAGLLSAAAHGASGAIAALAVLCPHSCYRVWNLCQEGRWDEARSAWQALAPLQRALARYGVAGLKAGAQLLDMPAGPPRPPLEPAGPEIQAEMAQALTLAGAL